MIIKPGFETEMADLAVDEPKDFEFKKKSDWMVGFGGSISAGVTLRKGRVYFGCADHHLYCVNAKTGKEAWRFRAKGILGDFRPLVNKNIVYFGSIDTNFYALDVKTGKLIWSFRTGGTIWSSPVYYDGLVIFGSWDCYLYALEWETGKEVWRFQTSSKNQSFHVYDIKYSFTGHVENVTGGEEGELYKKTETRVDLAGDVYAPLSQYATTDVVYGASKKKYGNI